MLGPWVLWEAAWFHREALLKEAVRERLLIRNPSGTFPQVKAHV
jgi:hypothetical protein